MKFYELPDNINDDIKQYEQMVAGYLAGNIHKTKLKAYRVPFGVYEQRQNNRYMMRIRLPGGAITPDQLVCVASIAKKYTLHPLHFTTRQDVQIHDLDLQDTVQIMNELKEIGMSSRGGGGNTVRNISGSYDTGVDEEDVFDVSPYIAALTTRMIAEQDSWTLPRKLKIAFSGNRHDRGLATVNDLGFIAKINEKGEKGFSVYIAGGMGRKPRIGTLLYGFVNDDQVYNLAKATKNMFDKHGNRKNKHKARLRFLLEKLGKTRFMEFFEEEYQAVKKHNYPLLQLPENGEIKNGSLKILLFSGDLKAEDAIFFGSMIKKYGQDILRVTQSQNILIRNISQEDEQTIIYEIKKSPLFKLFPDLIGNAVACAGASTCRLGVCLSRGLLKAVRNKLKETEQKYEQLKDLSLKISGCPNTCGHHLIADIGFYGIAQRSYGQLAPFYQLVAGGHIEEGHTQLAEKIGILPAKAIPEFLSDFLKFLTETRRENESFPVFLKRIGKEKLVELIHRYSPIPRIEEDSRYYYDWFSSTPFSLAEKSAGECSAGLSDLIELDFSMAEELLKQETQINGPMEKHHIIQNVILCTTRALLITKGLEPKEDRDTVMLFQKHFIGKHIGVVWSDIINKYLNNEAIALNEAQGLYEIVNSLYQSMDDSLRFPEMEEGVKKEEKDAPLKTHDFRGVACPLNFVKTKLVLEELDPGERVGILLDDGEPIDNVPASVKEEGHKILEKVKEENYWTVVIEKGRLI